MSVSATFFQMIQGKIIYIEKENDKTNVIYC